RWPAKRLKPLSPSEYLERYGPSPDEDEDQDAEEEESEDENEVDEDKEEQEEEEEVKDQSDTKDYSALLPPGAYLRKARHEKVQDGHERCLAQLAGSVVSPKIPDISERVSSTKSKDILARLEGANDFRGDL
ncbi:MAG: hypothetical protein L6R40_002450, partial [Gallowayella cf. fulva]